MRNAVSPQGKIASLRQTIGWSAQEGECAMDAEAAERLIQQLKDADAHVRQEAAAALGGLGSAAGAVTALMRALQDRSCGVRRRAAEALGKLGPAAEQAIPTLTECTRDPIHTVRNASWAAIQQIRGRR
jgi:HEAT repeat protein